MLDGANSYSGGTHIAAGMLQIGSGGTSGSLGSGDVTENGALVFNRSDAISVANVISGSGSLTKNGRPYALLRVDNLLYQVKAGDYLGQNFGKITKISETEIALREIVQDAAGEWIERTTSLELQERAR